MKNKLIDLIQTPVQRSIMVLLSDHHSGMPEKDLLAALPDNGRNDVTKLTARGLVARRTVRQTGTVQEPLVIENVDEHARANVQIVDLTLAGRQLTSDVDVATCDVGAISRQRVDELLLREVPFPAPSVEVDVPSMTDTDLRILVNRAWTDAHAVHRAWIEDVLRRIA